MSFGPPFEWMPGEHVAVIGDTGSGKTHLLARGLLRLRRYVVVFKTKPDPDDAQKWQGFKRIRQARLMNDERHERFLLIPEYRRQAIEGYDMINRVWRQGGWTTVIDEGWYAEKTLGLTQPIEMLLTQGRSKMISVVYGQQRPVTTSRFVISQATHVFVFRVEGRDAKTVAESTSPRMMAVIEDLDRYEFAYYNRATRFVGRGKLRNLGDLIVPPGTLAKLSRQPIDKPVVAT